MYQPPPPTAARIRQDPLGEYTKNVPELCENPSSSLDKTLRHAVCYCAGDASECLVPWEENLRRDIFSSSFQGHLSIMQQMPAAP